MVVASGGGVRGSSGESGRYERSSSGSETFSDCGVMWTRRGTDEKRYEMEPSTTPTEPSWYEVAKLALAREDSVSRRPRGVGKSSRAGRRCQRMGTRESKEVFLGGGGGCEPSDVALSAAYELSRRQPVAS